MIDMAGPSFDTRNLTDSVDHLATNIENLLEYVYGNCRDNGFLRNSWKALCLKVSHGVVVTRSLHHLEKELRLKKEVDMLEFALLLVRRFGWCTLLVWEIYKLMYTNWLKHLVEPSIAHKGIYPTEKKIEELKGLKIFTIPEQIDIDTHEIARRVAKLKTQFDVYNSYMLIGILSDTKTIVYLSYHQDKYVSIEKDKVDPDNKINFVSLGKAIELLTVWRAQFAHLGKHLLACEDIFNESYDKNSPPHFDEFNKEILRRFSSQALIFVRYLERLFWNLGDVIGILNKSCENIDEIFNYKIH